MADKFELADLPADVAVSPPQRLAGGYRDYQRYHVTLAGADGEAVKQQRDVLRAGQVVAVLPVDVARGELVLIRQFRLPAHLANGRGDLVEIVAGRVEPGEQPAAAARRECGEEIGIVPDVLVKLLSYLTTPGLTDEDVTIFLAAVDATQARPGARATPDGEQLHVLRVSVDAALEALARGKIHGSPAVIALQWLALNRGRLAEVLAQGLTHS
jgi:ADP-ribose pyrophosphatase